MIAVMPNPLDSDCSKAKQYNVMMVIEMGNRTSPYDWAYKPNFTSK